MTEVKSERPDVVILCGGQGKRMGGCDKGLLELAGRPLYQHVLEQLPVDLIGQVYLSANRNQAIYASKGLPVVVDVRLGFAGPLAGVEAVLMTSLSDWLFVLPCDMPKLPTDLLPRLWAVREQAPIIRAKAGDRVQPLCCLIHQTALPALRLALDAHQYAVIPWQDSVGVLEVAFEGSWINANDPDSLSKLAMD
ncbi:molybdenum cofactor guanylyltransferase MobA [Chitinimonas sp. PSY-7]|uniref:molybdenum cofactor guanylyltransferase MobA n=1 Tax=Chitinimonas sp. PSY-7 TaxID=3459088 RepID=UPI0040401D2E